MARCFRNMKDEFGWSALNIKSGLANTVEDIDRNIESSLSRVYRPLVEIIGTESGAVSVVGSGPSLKKNWTKLRDSDTDIMACNAACQFLLERDVVPKYMFCFDADPLMLEFLTPHPEIIYLIGSRCPPKTFEILEGCNVIVWHVGGDPNIEQLLIKHKKMEPIVAGGTAAITRAMMLVQPIGYTTVHLWGCDSSFDEGETHIRKSTTDELRMVVMANDRVFQTAPWMTNQIEDFKILAPMLRDIYGVKVILHGDGLMQWIGGLMGFETDSQNKGKMLWYTVKHKTRVLWSQL